MDGITGIIYMLTCRITEMSYIGQTIYSLKKRLSVHLGTKERHRIQRALHKYGIENFDIIILHENVPFKDLNWLEKQCIWIYNTISPNGYNLKDGGKNSIVSEETRNKLRNSSKGEKNHGYRKDIRDKKDIIFQKYKDGSSMKSLAEEFECSVLLIKKVFKENKIQTRMVPRKNIKRHTKEIIKEYEDGTSMVALGKKYNCSDTYIGNILKQNGIEISRLRKVRKYTREIIEGYENGMSTVDLSEKYNCTFSSIARILKENGVKLGKYYGRNGYTKKYYDNDIIAMYDSYFQ